MFQYLILSFVVCSLFQYFCGSKVDGAGLPRSRQYDFKVSDQHPKSFTRNMTRMFFSFTLGSIWCYFYASHIISIFFYVQCSLHMLDTSSLFTLFSLKKTSTRLPKLRSSNDQKVFTDGLPKALWPEASSTMLCPFCQDLCYHSPSAQLHTSSVQHYTQFRLQMITIAFYYLSQQYIKIITRINIIPIIKS